MSHSLWSYKELLAVIFVYTGLRVWFLARPHHVIWDEAVYLGMGKWLWSAGTLGLWEMIRPPVMPILYGSWWKLGLDPLFWGEVTTLAFGVGVIILSYLLAAQWNKETGILAALLVSSSTTFFAWSIPLLSGVASVFFVLVGWYLLLKDHDFWAGVALGIGALTRFPLGLGYAVVLGYLGWQWLQDHDIMQGKRMANVSMGFALMHLPFLVFNYLLYQPETSVWWHAMFRPWILGSTHAFNPSMLAGSYGYYVRLLLDEHLLFLGIVPALYYARKQLVWWGFFVLFGYFTYIGNRQERFALSFLPLVCVLAAYGWMRICKSKQSKAILFLIALLWWGLVSWPAIDALHMQRAPDVSITDYATFPQHLEGPVLTADPLPAAYSDQKFLPYYYSVDAARTITAPYPDQPVIWTNAFWCAPEDIACLHSVISLKKNLTRDKHLAFNTTYQGRRYEIFTSSDRPRSDQQPDPASQKQAS